MAEIVIAFDTKKKTLTVKKNGVEVPNVVCAEVCRADYYGYGSGGEDEEEDFKFVLTQVKADKDDDTKEMIRTMANEKGEFVPLSDEIQSLTPEQMRSIAEERKLVNQATKDIQAYFEEGF
jgi:hypothetical protein